MNERSERQKTNDESFIEVYKLSETQISHFTIKYEKEGKNKKTEKEQLNVMKDEIRTIIREQLIFVTFFESLTVIQKVKTGTRGSNSSLEYNYFSISRYKF